MIVMQLFPRPPFFRQNAYVRMVALETEGDERVAIIRAKAAHPIEIGDVLHFNIAFYVLNAPMDIYHGDRLIFTKDTTMGGATFDHIATSTADYFEFRSEGEGCLVEMGWPSITLAS